MLSLHAVKMFHEIDSTFNTLSSQIAQASAAAVAIASSVGVTPAAAGDKIAGQQVFNANCATCHPGGKNIIKREKTLEKEALDEYLTGGRNEGAVSMLVTNGKNAMPAFGRRLDEDQVQNVATYVIATSENGWDDVNQRSNL